MTLNEKPDSSMKIVKTKTLPPAEGERRAMRGYMGQYERAGAAIYAELERGQLEWIGVADRSAGIVDDLVLGFNGLIVGIAKCEPIFLMPELVKKLKSL